MKIVVFIGVFIYDAEIDTPQFIWYDEYLPTRHLSGGSITIQNPLPAVPRGSPEAGVLRVGTIFLIRV